MPDYQPLSDAYVGTSAVQHAEPDADLLAKNGATATQAADADVVQQDLAGDIGESNVRSIYWARRALRTRGTTAWNFAFAPPVQVFDDSQVSVSMTEIDANGQPFLGAARMQVYNVVPQADGSITVRFNVDWSEQLLVMFNFIIVN